MPPLPRETDEVQIEQVFDIVPMECPNGCSVPMKTVRVERIFYRAGKPIVIRGLEMYVCPECGCESMPLGSARIVETILNGRMEPIGQFSAPLFQSAQPV